MAHARNAQRITLGFTLGALALATAPGCTGYSSYPNASGSLTRSTTSTRSAVAVMRESLRWTTSRTSGTPERFAINLPEGINADAYAAIASAVGGEALSSSNTDLPRYSVTRVWVRSGQAKVDVVRPVLVLGKNPDGRYPTQGITIELEGGLEPWRVVRYRPWAIGTLADAPPNFIDEAAFPGEGGDALAEGGDDRFVGETDAGGASDERSVSNDERWSSERSSGWSSKGGDEWAFDDEALPDEGRPEASAPTDSPDVIEINP